MVVSAVMTLILAATFQVFIAVNKRGHLIEDRASKLDQMHRTMTTLDRELRQATIVNSVSGPSLDFCTYLTPTSASTSRVVYTAGADGVLTRKVGSATAVKVLDGLLNQAVFSSGDTTRTVTEVVSIDLQVKPALSPNASIVLDSDVRLRNVQEVVSC
jgi:hypothetical protein